jgi:hypothetical protein
MVSQTKKSYLFRIVLISIFAFQLVMPLFFILNIYLVKLEQQNLIETNRSLEELIISQADFKSVIQIDEHEIWYQHQLFDIASVTYKAGNYMLEVVKDERETNLSESENNQTNKDLLALQLKQWDTIISVLSPFQLTWNQLIVNCPDIATWVQLTFQINSRRVPSPPPDFFA